LISLAQKRNKMNLKVILVIVLALGLITSCKNKPENNNETNSSVNSEIDPDQMPVIKFDNDFANLGVVIQGEKVEHTFKFKNIGKSDLVINDAVASCGCTVPSFSKDPIVPGGEGEIKVVFNSANRTGRQMKSITVWTNAQPNQSKIQFQCEIVVPK